jgi:WD40 repeat protein
MKNWKFVPWALLALNGLAIALAIVHRRSPGHPPAAQILEGHQYSVQHLAFAPDSQTLASAAGERYKGGEVKLWDVASGQERTTLRGHEGAVYAVAFSPDSRLLATGSLDRTVRLWDATTGAMKATLRSHHDGLSSVQFAPDGQTLVSSSLNQEVKTWEVASGKELAGQTLPSYGRVTVGPDGHTLAALRPGGWNVRLWDLAAGTELVTLPGPRCWGFGVAFSPNGQRLAAAGIETMVYVWNRATSQVEHLLDGHDEIVNAVAFSPDSRALATGSKDRTVKLWDVATGEEKATLTGHAGAINAVAYAPDGRTLASGSYDRTVRLWRVPQ